MFTLDATIDAIQTGKKTFVNTFVQNDTIKDSLIKFVDAQAEYTKKAAKVGMDAFTTVSSETLKVAQEAAKFDYIGAMEQFTKTFQPKK
jgi:hypothetical protein